MQTEQITRQNITEPGLEGVTIHIEPMPESANFAISLAVNGRVMEKVPNVGNDNIPKYVARLLQRGATQYAYERPEFIRKAAAAAFSGAFRKIFRKDRGV